MLTMTGAAKIVNNIIKCGEKYSVRYIWKNMIKKCPKLFSSFRSSVIQTHYILLYLPILGWGRCCLLSHSLDPILFMQNIRLLQQPLLLLPLYRNIFKKLWRGHRHTKESMKITPKNDDICLSLSNMFTLLLGPIQTLWWIQTTI